MISTCYSGVPEHKNQISLFDKDESRNTKGRILIVDKLDNFDNIDNLLSNKTESDYIYDYLNGNGDFRSEEVSGYRDISDIIITNCPFSLFRDFISWVTNANKQFAVIGNKNAITYKEVFPILKDNKIWLGNSSPSEFILANGEIKNLQGLCRWFTNIDIGKQYKNLEFNKKYNPNEYQRFDNFPSVINVNKVSEIPVDYDGYIGVPITFLDCYNPEQYELLDALNTYTVMDYFGMNKVMQKYHSHGCMINGKCTYRRIIIRKIKKEDE